MYPLQFASNLFRSLRAAGVSAMFVYPPLALTAPVLRVATDVQCAVSLDSSTPAHRKDEGVLEALGGGLLGSAADSLVSAGIAYIKTKLDPKNGMYVDQITMPHDGMFVSKEHNRDLGCVMIAIFDASKPGNTAIPLSDQAGRRAIEGDAKFDAKAVTTNQRLDAVFPGTAGRPILYLELVRRYSADGTAHYYQPVYAFVERMVRPHILSNDPVWEVSLSWMPLGGTLVDLGTAKFAGTPPFERSATELNQQGQGWLALTSPEQEEAQDGVWRPLSISVNVKEHRTATHFATALAKALEDNQEAIKQAIRDQYPWRAKDVKTVANEKAQADARTTVEAYLTALDKFSADCLGQLSPTAKIRCEVSYVQLRALYSSASNAVKSAPILPDGVKIPEPPNRA